MSAPPPMPCLRLDVVERIDFAALPEPIRIPPYIPRFQIPRSGAPCSLRSFDWGKPFTSAEQAKHVKAREDWRAEGGVPNMFVSTDDAVPQPWLGVRRVVVAEWRKAFGRTRPDADIENLLSSVLTEISKEFTLERIRNEPGRVVRFAERIVKAEIIDLLHGIRRKRSGLLSIVNDRRTARLYADNPVFSDFDSEVTSAGGSGDRACRGKCPSSGETAYANDLGIHSASALDENELHRAIDLRKAGVTSLEELPTRAELLGIRTIDLTDKIFSKLWGPKWTSSVR